MVAKLDYIVMFIAAVLTPIFIVIFQKHKVPKMLPLTRVPDNGLLPFPQPPRDLYEQELQELGFRYLGDFDTTMSTRMRFTTRLFLSANGLHGAAISVITASMQSGGRKLFELGTSLAPKGEITTSIGQNASAFVWPSEKVVVNAPWKKTTAELLELHEQLCKVASSFGFTPKRYDPKTFANEFRDDLRRDFEAQVLAGRMRRTGDDEYALSFVGAIIAFPKVMISSISGFIRHSFPPSNEALCEKARLRLQAARQGL